MPEVRNALSQALADGLYLKLAGGQLDGQLIIDDDNMKLAVFPQSADILLTKKAR